MSAGAIALLSEYALGLLPEEEASRFEAALATSDDLARELDQALVAFARTAETLTPLTADPGQRARLLRTLESVDRFAPFFARAAALLDLPLEAVRPILARIDDPTAWERGLPGMHLIHFQAGPRLASADAGFVRLQPGMAFPRHRHLGDEVTLVLEGGMFADGRTYGPGEQIEMATGTVHEYRASPERDLLILTVHTGIIPVFEGS